MLHSPYRLIGSRLSPRGADARLSILIYHRVLPAPDPLFPSEPTVATFDAHMAVLKAVFNVLPLAEAAARLQSGTLPARAACITFDDGYADNVTQALPILQKHGLHATFFIATDYLNGGRMFNDTVIESVRRCRLARLDLDDLALGVHDIGPDALKSRAIGQILPQVKYRHPDERERVVGEIVRRAAVDSLPDDLMMTTAQLRALHRAGMEIGGHTCRHPILATLDDAAVRDEIAVGKRWLEETLDAHVRLFAYPNGKPGADYLASQTAIVRELGFDAAVSTEPGVSTRAHDVYQLRRFTPWDTGKAAFALRLLQNLQAHGPTP